MDSDGSVDKTEFILEKSISSLSALHWTKVLLDYLEQQNNSLLSGKILFFRLETVMARKKQNLQKKSL
jgi:hypothetical protein